MVALTNMQDFAGGTSQAFWGSPFNPTHAQHAALIVVGLQSKNKHNIVDNLGRQE